MTPRHVLLSLLNDIESFKTHPSSTSESFIDLKREMKALQLAERGNENRK